MLKFTYDHVTAIEHGALFLLPAIDKSPEQRYRRQLENDIERLDELKKFALSQIYTPVLPLEAEN